MCDMGGKLAFHSVLLGGVLALAAAPACADGMHFGGGGGFPGFHFGGPRFDGPRFDGPRFDGPRPHDPGGAPPPHEPAMRGPPGPPPHEPPDSPPPESSRSRTCVSPSESRARVAQYKLRPPFEMMRRAAALADAQALAGKLCRWADLDIYDISLLRPDGRVVHVYLDAETGHEVSPPNPK